MVRKLLATDVERIESTFPCLLGLTILLLQPIFVSKKKQWKMESTKQIRSIRPIRSIRGQKSNPYSLPFREGQGVGFFREEQGVGFLREEQGVGFLIAAGGCRGEARALSSSCVG